MDIKTYVIYLALPAIAFLLAKLSQLGFKTPAGFTVKCASANYILLTIAVMISFSSAIRYEVGVDWEGYVNSYETQRITGYDRDIMDRWEYGYASINRFYASMNAGYQWMFFTVSLIGWFSFLKSIPRVLLPLTILFTFTGELYFWSNNAVRQFVAAAFFAYSLFFIEKRDFVKYCVTLALGSLFHFSILLMLPLYFFILRVPVNKVVMPAIMISTFAAGQTSFYVSILKFIENNLKGFLNLFGYSGYIGEVQNVDVPDIGLGFYWMVLTNFLLVTIIPRTGNSSGIIRVFFVSFFVGAILFNLLWVSQLFGRITIYFLFLKPILLSYVIVYMKNSISGVSLKVLLLAGYFVIYLSAIENSSQLCCPYDWAF